MDWPLTGFSVGHFSILRARVHSFQREMEAELKRTDAMEDLVEGERATQEFFKAALQ